MHRISCLALLLLTVSHGALAASVDTSEQGTATGGTPPGLTDHDGNRIADSLDAQLAGASPNDRFAVVVSFRRPTTPAAAERAVGPFTLRRVLQSINGFSGEMTKAQIQGLARTPGLFRIEPVSTVEAYVDDARSSFGVDAVHGATWPRTGRGVAICVIDTGADPAHEQLDGKDLDAPGRFLDLVGGLTAPYDDQGHGSHVAAIAAGDGIGGANGDRYRGVAPDADLYVVKALDSLGFGDNDVIIQAMEWCAGQGADVINMSIGDSALTDGQDAMSLAVNNLTASSGAIFVTSAGNAGPHPETVGSPACARDSLAVAAVASWSQDGDYLAPFSSRGPCSVPATWSKPDVAAPGVGVTSAMAGSGSGYVAYSGTSMAAPFTSGAVALAVEARRSTGLGLTLDELRSLLDETAVERGPLGHDLDWGRGLIDVARLVCAAEGGSDCPASPFPTYTRRLDTIPPQVYREYTFTIDDTSVPIAATLDIVGSYGCVSFFFCGWIPDMELALLAPDGSQLDLSTCPADDDCGAQSLFGSGQNGRQETVHAWPSGTGTYTLRAWIADDLLNDGVSSATFALDVTRGPLVADGGPVDPPANQPPVANDDTGATPYETPVTIAVLANDDDPDGGPEPLSIATITDPSSGTAVVNADQTVSFTPAAGFSGLAGFDYTITDGVDVAGPASVSITVGEPPNQPPVAVDDAAITDQDVAVTISVLLNDDPVDGDTLFVAAVTDPAHGSVASTDSTVTYTPDPGFFGTDGFTYTVADGRGGSDSALVTVTVREVAPPPPSSVHVGDLDGSSTNQGKTWDATVRVVIHDAGDTPVSGAAVGGVWSPGGSGTCTTDSVGACEVVLTGTRKKDSSVTFTVTSVASEVGAYAAADNHDPDGDSINGTSITVAKP